MAVGDPGELADKVLSGNRRAVARAITLLEQGDDRAKEIMKCSILTPVALRWSASPAQPVPARAPWSTD